LKGPEAHGFAQFFGDRAGFQSALPRGQLGLRREILRKIVARMWHPPMKIWIRRVETRRLQKPRLTAKPATARLPPAHLRSGNGACFGIWGA